MIYLAKHPLLVVWHVSNFYICFFFQSGMIVSLNSISSSLMYKQQHVAVLLWSISFELRIAFLRLVNSRYLDSSFSYTARPGVPLFQHIIPTFNVNSSPSNGIKSDKHWNTSFVNIALFGLISPWIFRSCILYRVILLQVCICFRNSKFENVKYVISLFGRSLLRATKIFFFCSPKAITRQFASGNGPALKCPCLCIHRHYERSNERVLRRFLSTAHIRCAIHHLPGADSSGRRLRFLPWR